MKRLCSACGAVVILLVAGSVYSARGTLYYGNAYGTTNASTLSGGTLQITDNGTKVSATFYKGPGSVNNNIVFYLDNGTGGFRDTTQFSDATDRLRRAISGTDGSSRSTAYFAQGFSASYAIALGIDAGGSLYRLAPGGNGSLIYVKDVAFTPANNANSASYTFNFNWSDIGEATGPHGFRFQSTYVSDYGYRYLQSFETLQGLRGFNPVTFDFYNVYGVEPIPETTSVALAIFGGLAVTGGAAAAARRRWASWRRVRRQVAV